MRVLKAEFQLNKASLLTMLLIQLGMFLFGVLLAMIIIRFADADTYFPLGSLMSLVAVGFSAIFLDGMAWQTQFQTAIAMGRTRRSLIPAHLLWTLCHLLLGVATTLLLGFAEDALYALIYPNMEREFSLARLLLSGWKYLLLGMAGCCVLGLLFAAVYGRFRQKGFFILYFGGLFTFLFAQRVTAAVQERPESLLARFGMALAKPFGAVTGGVWLGIGVLTVGILTILSVRWLLIQRVDL